MEQQQPSGNKWDGKRPDPITMVKEGWYDKLLQRIPLTVKTMNIIIVLLFLILIVVLVVGILKGNGTL